jgi:hypothetical protein
MSSGSRPSDLRLMPSCHVCFFRRPRYAAAGPCRSAWPCRCSLCTMNTSRGPPISMRSVCHQTRPPSSVMRTHNTPLSGLEFSVFSKWLPKSSEPLIRHNRAASDSNSRMALIDEALPFQGCSFFALLQWPEVRHRPNLQTRSQHYCQIVAALFRSTVYPDDSSHAEDSMILAPLLIK